MKKFLTRLAFFAVIIIICDFLFGFIGNALFANAKGGDSARIFYIANKLDANILLFGSSRTEFHYDPDILADTLGTSVYNCGFTHDGIICAYGFYRMVTERYLPKVIIYEITPGSDLQRNENAAYLGNLRYFYDRDYIDSIFWNVDVVERYKMLSKLYRYNSVFPQLITNRIHPVKSFANGYHPQDKRMEFDLKPLETEEHYEYDSLKLHYIEKLIQDCSGKTRLIFTVSPLYQNTEDKVLKPIRVLCDKYQIPLICHYTDSTLNFHKDYFYDHLHLSKKGATAYSKTIAHEIKNLLPSPQ